MKSQIRSARDCSLFLAEKNNTPAFFDIYKKGLRELKKTIVAIALSMAAMSANAECMIYSLRDVAVAEAFQKHGGWHLKDFQTFCAKLAKANARIQVSASNTVLDNRSIGWAHLAVLDMDTGVGSMEYASMNTYSSTYASQDTAEQIMVAAINAAADGWADLDKALLSLEEERKKAKSIYAKKRK